MKASNSIAEANPDVIVEPSGAVRLTIVIEKINSDHYDGVTVDGVEATYRERRDAAFASDNRDLPILRNTNPCRASFTMPLSLASGFGIGSRVVLTIAKAEGQA